MGKTENPAFDVKISTPLMEDDRPVSIEDFCRYLIQPNAYFFIPCRELWPGTSVNARLPRIPVLDKNGRPKHDKNGKADQHSRDQMDRRQSPRRANHLASWSADVHPRSIGGRRRLGRKTRYCQLQSLSTPKHRP